MDISQSPGFYAIAQADPDRVAVIDTDGSRTTYGELHALVNQVSHGLRGRGLGTGDVVAGVLPNGLDQVIMLMATGQIGLYYVPINWHLAAPEIDYIVKDSEAKLVVTSQEYAVPGAEIGTAGLADGQPATAPGDRTAGAVMWYTSGTTGRPKGVQRPLPGAEPEAIVPMYTWFLGEVADLKPGDGIHLVTSPMYHSSPCAHTQFALHFGHTVVIAPRFEPETVLELIERHRVTNAMMVPTMFHRMLQLLGRGQAAPRPLQPPAGHPHRRRLPGRRQARDHGLVGGPVLYEYYGSTESTIAFSVKPHDWLARPGTVGRPAPTFEARILAEDGTELPPGEPGLVYVKSSLGKFEYRKDPAKTAASMRGEWYAPRRHRLPGRGRLPVPVRPAHRPHHLRRGQHLPRRDRGRAAGTPLGRRRRRHRGARRGVGPQGGRPRRARPRASPPARS
ncbi:AMP-binding protein [Nonomuraea ferruginea]